MKLQLFVLVCCLASLANCLFISGIPNTICGEEGLNVSFGSFSAPTNVSVVASVPTVGISPNFLSLFPPEASEVITVTCNTINAVKISFVDPISQFNYATFTTYCKGVVYIQNPISSIIRGNDFSTTLILFPTPQSVVDIVVKIDNPIVVPGSDRLTFGVGQNTEDELFYVPAGDVGHVNIAFDSRSLRDYSGPNCQELVLSFDVLGTITSDLAAKTLGDGVFTDVTVQIHPPARDTVIVNIDASSIGIAEPPFLVYHTGQDIATFRLLPKFENVTSPTTVIFTAEYYDTLVEFIYVIGTIFTSIPPIVPTTGVADLHVAILPGAGEVEVVVYLTASSNVIVPPFLVFPPGVSLLHFSLQAITEGPAFVTFTSEGYVAFTDSFLVQDLDCSATQTFNINSTQCVSCPVLNGSVCSGNGVCSFSTIDQYKARCVCNAGFTGGYCELADPSAFAYHFTSSGITFEYDGIPGVIETDITVHPETVVDNNPIDGGNGTVYIRGYDSASPFPLAVNPSANAPFKLNFRTVTLEPGFGIDVTYSDNTIFDILDNPITVTFVFDDAVISQTEFLEMSLYYYNVTLKAWVPAISTCPVSEQLLVPSLSDLTIETNLCALGQYQFFAFIPIPQNPVVAPVYTYNNYHFGHQEDYQFATTGQTGVQQQAPPQPNLPVIANDPSPPRNIAEEDNASSFVAPSFLLPILLVLSLLF